MDPRIKEIIEEKFASKRQQRYFYAKANDKSLSKKERKKWKKWAKEYSDKTNFKKLPERAEEEVEVDEIVDKDGNIQRGNKPSDFETKGITQKSTTDKTVKTGTGQMGNTFGFGFAGGRSGSAKTLRYWAESDMSKSLGYEDTMGRDEDREDAENHFKNELGVSDEETKDRLDQMGYDETLPEDKIRLVENPLKYIEEYLESILPKKAKIKDVLEKDEETSVTPIIRRQIQVLKKTMKNNGISKETLLKYLEDNDE